MGHTYTHENHQKPSKGSPSWNIFASFCIKIFKHFESSLSTSLWWAQQNSQEVDDVSTRPNSTLLRLSADLYPMRRRGLSATFQGRWGQAKLSTFSSFCYSGFFITELHLPGNFGGDKEATRFLSRNFSEPTDFWSICPYILHPRTLVSWMLQSLQRLWIHSQQLLTNITYFYSGHRHPSTIRRRKLENT